MKKTILFLTLVICSAIAFAGTIAGTVRDEKGAPIAFASITVKGTTKGAITNNLGKYSLQADEGTYTLVCQHVGYKTEEKKISISSSPIELDFVLAVQYLEMKEVIIKKGEDPALEIMRQAIKKREFYNKQIDSFTVDVYIKGLVRLRSVPNRVLGQKVDKKELRKSGLDSSGKGILFLSESLTKVAYKRPDKLKLEVVSSRESGGGLGVSFPFFVNFYTPNVKLFSDNLNTRGFVSPLADGAFHYYKFKFEGSFMEDGKLIDRIRVTPKRKNEPLFDGYLQIVDEEWRIHSLNLSTNKSQGLDLLDTIRVTQIHSEIEKDVYKTANQVVSFAANFFGFDNTGEFLNVYSNYNIRPGFSKGYFDRVLMKYDTAYNKRDSVYWTGLRPVPLEADERKDFIVKDSIRRYNADSLENVVLNDSTRRSIKSKSLGELVTKGYTKTHYGKASRTTFAIEPLLWGAEYNTVEGLSLSFKPSLTLKPWKSKYNYTIASDSRYGFSNQHFLSYGTFTVRPKEEAFRNRYLQLSGGKALLQFNRQNPIKPLTNTVHTLLYKKNYLKVYETWFGKLTYNNRLVNGLSLNVEASYEDRIPVENYTDFSLFKKDRTILPNHPYELANISFNRHAAVVTSVTLSYQPGQRYIELPRAKVPVGSKYPTLELQYAKGIPGLFSSVADFDKWKFSVYDNVNMQLAGLLKYKISAGGFLNNRRVDIPDFTHFNGNQLTFASDYLNSFQLAPYYQYSNTEALYGLLHVEHHFNGLLTNKIPLFNKLKWNLVAGTNTFYVNRSNYYVEAFAGLENIFKLFRVDFVTATQAQGGTAFGVRVGLGGVIGGSISVRR